MNINHPILKLIYTKLNITVFFIEFWLQNFSLNSIMDFLFIVNGQCLLNI